MDELSPPFFIGHHDDRRILPVTSQSVQEAHTANYDMLTSPITTPHFHSRVLTLLSSYLADSTISSSIDLTQSKSASPVLLSPLTPADSPLTPDETISQIIGVTSGWIDLCSPDPIIADVSRQVLKLELSYAAFCGLTYVLIPGPRLDGLEGNESGLLQYARAILDGLGAGPFMQIYIWLPMIDHSDDDKEEMGDLNPFARQYFASPEEKPKRLDLFRSWEAWDMIRSLCKYSPRLSIALNLPKLLPPVPIQSRWYSEPVKLLTLDASIFSKNPKGYPVLSKAHQALISRFIRLRVPPWFLLCNSGLVPPVTNGTKLNGMTAQAFPTPAESSLNPSLKDPTPQLSYMRNLQSKQPPLAPIHRFGAGYQDYLQAPLQPLAVNLESITYEVFEKDPVKYDWYEKAIARALHDWVEQGKPTSNPDGRVVVAVVGAGRGPLVTRALKAGEDVGVEMDMWALEKNPNAFVLLQRHNENIWNRRVNLVKSDMRTWRGPVRQANAKHISQIYNKPPEEDAHTDPTAPISATYTGCPETDSTYLLATATHQPAFYKIDILISELLGSFADNELSPECLDGVQHLLNSVHGISIPASYTAFISPISAPKLYADINNSMLLSTPNAQEIPYVVMLNAIDHVSVIERADATAPPSDSTEQFRPDRQSSTAHHRPQPSTASVIPQPPQPVILPTWSFHHPNSFLPAPSPTPTNAHNTRFSSTFFPTKDRATIHGLAGYFESVLYPGVELSTNPLTMDNKSEGMISWFPIYFPLKSALFAPDNSEVQISMWRKTDERKVWYEWQVDIFIHIGQTGQGITKSGVQSHRKVRIGGSELHSSEKEGCLM